MTTQPLLGPRALMEFEMVGDFAFPAMMELGGIAQGSGEAQGEAAVILTETWTVAARFTTTQPSKALLLAMDAPMQILVPSAAWARADGFRFIGPDEQATRQNWRQDLYNATRIGDVSFVPFEYWQNGADGYLDSGYNPTTAVGGKFGRYQHAYFSWQLNNVAENAQAMSVGAVVTHGCYVVPRNAAGNLSTRSFTNATPTVSAGGTSVGLTDVIRVDDTGYSIGRDGAEISAQVAPTTGFPSANIFHGRGNNGSSTGQYMMQAWGAFLPEDRPTIKAAAEAWRDAIAPFS